MTYSAVTFDFEKYGSLVAGWWEDHGWPAMPSIAFPPNGLMILHGDKPVAAGWLYLTDSIWAILEWVIADKKAEKAIRRGALDVLIPDLLQIARQNEKSIVFSSIKHTSLIEAYKRHGMMVSDENMTNFVWRAK